MRLRGLAIAVVVSLLLGACASIVDGRPTAGVASNASLKVVGDSGSPIDALVKNALADVTTFWQQNYPTIAHGAALPPLKGGLFSIDAAQVVSTGKVAGPAAKEGCVAEDASFIVDNAAYCKVDDSIVWDRDPNHVFGVFARQYGPLMVALAFAHEYGHAIQERLGIFNQKVPTIDTESQADCAAGAFLASVQAGKSSHFRASAAQLDLALNGYLQVRDVTPDSPSNISHGDGFDRLSAIDDGLAHGVSFCYSATYFDRQFTERPFVNDSDYVTGGNETLAQVLDPNDPKKDANAGGLIPDLNRFWTKSAQALGKTWANVSIAEAAHPKCGTSTTSEFGYCPEDNTVYYSQDFASAAYYSLAALQINPANGDASVAQGQPADFALGTLFAMGWSMAARHQLSGTTLDGADALLGAACDTGAYAKDINITVSATFVFALSPPDMDEATSAMLNLVGDPRAYASRGTSGLQRVQSFVKGYNGGVASC